MIQTVSAGYRVAARDLLSDVTLSLGAGEVLAVAGPNGAGKSTLLRLMSGELSPASGEVRLFGRRPDEWAPRDLARRRAVLPQIDGVRSPISAREVVELGRAPWRGGPAARDREAVDRAMRATAVTALSDRSFPTLSGGERRRVHLARVLAQLDPWRASEPGVLLLDEPVAGLDPAHQHQVLAWSRAIAGFGVGVVAVLHDLNLAASHADRVALLKGGRLAAVGSPQDVLTTSHVRDVFGWTVRVMDHPCRDCPLLVPEFGPAADSTFPMQLVH